MMRIKLPMRWWAYDSRTDHHSYAFNMPERRRAIGVSATGVSGGFYFFADEVWDYVEPTAGVFEMVWYHKEGMVFHAPHICFQDDDDAILFKLTHM